MSKAAPEPTSYPTLETFEYSVSNGVKMVLHLTRNWLLYGGYSFVVFCTLIGAIKALLY